VTLKAVRELGPYLVLEVADLEGPKPAPGQFAMLAAAEGWGAGVDERPYLPRAFSYARWRDGHAHFLLEDVGPGTHRLAELMPGERLWLMGPLGRGFTTPTQGRRALLVGGGVGLAPLAIWQDELGGATALLGFRDGAHAQGAALLGRAEVCSEDGSVGHRGLVTDLLRRELDRDGHTTVYACGPPAMLEAVRALCAERATAAQLALEAGMACGYGACFGCVVATREGYLRACLDGPVLDAQRLEHIGGDP
jgi:NAD(P)H-flavin reductase